jgi:hypothetical protein
MPQRQPHVVKLDGAGRVISNSKWQIQDREGRRLIANSKWRIQDGEVAEAERKFKMGDSK